MKKFLISSILILTIFNISFAQISSDEGHLKALVRNSFDDVFSNMDVESIPEYFTEDFILLERGEVWDLNKLKSMLNSDYMNDVNRLNDFEFIQIKINGDSAWLTYHNKASFQKGDEIVGEMNWLESATAIRTKEGWRMDMLHSTRKPQNE